MRYSRTAWALVALVAGLAVAAVYSGPAFSAAEQNGGGRSPAEQRTPRRSPGDLAAATRPPTEQAGTPDPTDPSKVHGCLITPLQSIEVPADLPSTEGGMLLELKVREGDEVKAGDVVALIDDRQANFAKKAAYHRVLGAEKEAGNEISVKYAEAKNYVAQAAFDKGEQANVLNPKTTPELELIKLKADVYASLLETKHAKYQLEIAAINVDVRKAELDQAELDVVRRQIKARIGGVIVKRHREEGEWVRAGDPIVQILRMDKLRIETFLDGAKLIPADVDKQPVTVVVNFPHGPSATFEGKVDYASPEIEQGPKFHVKVDVVNRQQDGHWLLLPGYEADMTIQLKKR